MTSGLECLSEIDFEQGGLSPDVLYPMMASALYGLGSVGSGGLSEGDEDAGICFPIITTHHCGSCTNDGKKGKTAMIEWVCFPFGKVGTWFYCWNC